jgi:hypothetical protein
MADKYDCKCEQCLTSISLRQCPRRDMIDILRVIRKQVEKAFPSQMGGTPDLFYPKGYEREASWEAWEEETRKLLA